MTEVEEAKALIERAYVEVIEEGFIVKQPLVGVMIEVPAAVYQARKLARQVDFLAVVLPFSQKIGSSYFSVHETKDLRRPCTPGNF